MIVEKVLCMIGEEAPYRIIEEVQLEKEESHQDRIIQLDTIGKKAEKVPRDMHTIEKGPTIREK